MTIPSSLASAQSAWLEGPGIGSARAKRSWSSRWQKYSERKSSWVETICAPFAAACRMRSSTLARLAAGSAEQDIWTRPTFTGRVAGVDMAENITCLVPRASSSTRRHEARSTKHLYLLRMRRLLLLAGLTAFAAVPAAAQRTVDWDTRFVFFADNTEFFSPYREGATWLSNRVFTELKYQATPRVEVR